MSKKTISIFALLIFSCIDCEAQLPTMVKTLLNNNKFQLWQRRTISIGRVEQKLFKGKKYPYYDILGSGLIAYIHVGDSTMPVIITAKHVVLDKKKNLFDTIRVRFSWQDNKSIYDELGYRFLLKDKKSSYVYALPDTTIDLVCIPFNTLMDSIKEIDNRISILAYSEYATQQDYFEGLDVFVLGYPASIGSTYWTRGLLRKGIISWLPPTDIEKKKFIIDCSVFPGNSGGPVFAFPKAGDFLKPSDTSTLEDKFYGIVTQRRLNYNDVFENKKSVKTPQKSVYISPESMSVGIVEPAMNVLNLLRFTEKHLNELLKKEAEKINKK